MSLAVLDTRPTLLHKRSAVVSNKFEVLNNCMKKRYSIKSYKKHHMQIKNIIPYSTAQNKPLRLDG